MSAYQVDTDVIDLIVTATLDGWGDRHTTGISVHISDLANLVIHTQDIRDRIDPLGEHGPTEARLQYGRIQLAHQDYEVLGRELIAANIASLACRYSDCKTDRIGGLVGYLPESYKFRAVPMDRFADLIHVLGAIEGYRYQTCEVGDEDRSFWGRFCTTAERRIVSILPGVGDGWGWSRAWAEEQKDKLRAEIGRNGLTLVKP